MTALAAERDTIERDGSRLSLAAAAAVIIYAGALVARDGSGNAVPGKAAAGLLGAGRATATVDNAGGAAGDKTVEIDKGIFRFANSAAGDLVTRADIGKDCYIADDQTVAKTNGSGARSVAGQVFDVDARGVWVDFR